MLKRSLLLICAALLTGSVMAQDFLYQEALPRHEASLGYGILSINDIPKVTNSLFPMLSGTEFEESWGTGSINLSYAYRLNKVISVGGIFGYSGNINRGKVTGITIYKNYASILPQVKFEWYRSGIITLYSRVGAGVLIASIYDRTGALLEENKTVAAFTFQVSPIGLTVGRDISGFFEAGFGATGVITLGLRQTF